MEKRIAHLEALVAQLTQWQGDRKRQQLTFPLDRTSKNIMGAYTREGVGSSTLTQNYNVSGGAGGSVTGPKAYVTSRVIIAEGERIEVPVISLP